MYPAAQLDIVLVAGICCVGQCLISLINCWPESKVTSSYEAVRETDTVRHARHSSLIQLFQVMRFSLRPIFIVWGRLSVCVLSLAATSHTFCSRRVAPRGPGRRPQRSSQVRSQTAAAVLPKPITRPIIGNARAFHLSLAVDGSTYRRVDEFSSWSPFSFSRRHCG